MSIERRIILCFHDGRREEFVDPHGCPSSITLAHEGLLEQDGGRTFRPTGEVRLDGAVFYAEDVRDPDLCTVCGLPIAVGQWPCVSRIVAHGKSVQTDPFSSYFDIGLGEEVSSLGDRWQAMKEQRDPQTDEVVRERLEYRDKMSKGDQSARLDRVAEQLHEQARRR